MLWAVLTSYGVGMLFIISHALNEPFGRNIHGIKLNRLSARIARDLLVMYAACPLSREVLMDENHETPTWLEDSLDFQADKLGMTKRITNQAKTTVKSTIDRLRSRPISSSVKFSMLLFLGWCCFIIVLTHQVSQGDAHAQVYEENPPRWWWLYIPITAETMNYISLGVFLVLGIWLNEAYDRYWRGLQLWQSDIRPKLQHFAFQICMTCRRGLWHERDRERILSYAAALPYAIKHHLRGSRDLSELRGILSEKDLFTLTKAPIIPLHIYDVLSAYMMEVDSTLLSAPTSILSTFGAASVMLTNNLPNMEVGFFGCNNLLKFPIAPAFTKHLELFTAFWLALLPLTIVLHDGFLSFLYLIPIGYSILKLLDLGREMSYPFNTCCDDIPLNRFCEELKQSIVDTYRQTSGGVHHFIHKSPYDRGSFMPKPRNGIQEHAAGSETDFELKIIPTFSGSLRKFIRRLPRVSIWAQAIVLLWAVVATLISWRLRVLWPSKQSDCMKWCSPIDVQPNVLSNIGFALFMILAFRVSDALGRYAQGAQAIFDLRVQLRSLAIEVVQSFRDGMMHECDKERIVAHIIQIPICFRSILLEGTLEGESGKKGLLSGEDQEEFENASEPLDHLLKTVEAYFLTADMPDKAEYQQMDKTVGFIIIFSVIMRMGRIRELIAKILSVKEFPVVGSYVRHQRVFMWLWLILLPLAMTSWTGFFTIFWATLISYGVLALEAIAVKLVDPFGSHSSGLPVDEMFKKSTNAILESLRSVEWDIFRPVRSSVIDEPSCIGSMMIGNKIFENYTLPRLEPRPEAECGAGPRFEVPYTPKMKPSLLAHFLRSVPYRAVAVITLWATIACVMSFISRTGSEASRWWTPFISVHQSVTGYISFGAFTSLGFYVQAAFSRYNKAGNVWGDELRGMCHGLTSVFMSYFPSNELHDGDTERVVGHIAALPIALKAELRRSRDIRSLKGLLSSSDLTRLQCAGSMSLYCLTVVRSYYHKVVSRQETINSKKVAPGRLNLILLMEFFKMERIIQTCLMLKSVPIASDFVILLKVLLGIWFFILPFVLTEISGWFTIAWVTVIAYGVLGVYKVAEELQNPYGPDLNDLDLDEIANSIVADVISAYRMQRGGYETLVVQTEVPTTLWEGSYQETCTVLNRLFRERDRMSTKEKVKEAFSLALRAVSVQVLCIIAFWSAAIIAVAYVVGRYLPLKNSSNCGVWFCSAIAIDTSVKDYVGFALFLLLGFHLNDSHRRYVIALTVWREGVVGGIRLFTNRLFASYGEGSWHEGDMRRIAGHAAAFPICLMGRLRNVIYPDKLREVLGAEDVERVLAAEVPADYCIDVLRAYMIKAEKLQKSKGSEFGSGIELVRCMHHLRALAATIRSCTQLVRVPLPFGYVQHLRIFMYIWIVLLPLGLVESSGWLSILWVPIISYGIIGIETWAKELSNPFTLKMLDVRLEKLCERVIAVIKLNVHNFKDGNKPYIQQRPAFPLQEPMAIRRENDHLELVSID